MKKLAYIVTLLVSMAASAGEILVLDLSFWKVGHDEVTSRFKVNQKEETVSVKMHVEKMTSGRRSDIGGARNFEVIVPELSMMGDTLTLTVDGQAIDCGTMGVTRIFKRPVLNLNGNCKLEGRTVRTDEGLRYQLFLKY